MKIEEARKELAMFLEQCKHRSIFCVLIIHGKGYGSKNKSPIIKNKLNQWLRHHDMVWGFAQRNQMMEALEQYTFILKVVRVTKN